MINTVLIATDYHYPDRKKPLKEISAVDLMKVVAYLAHSSATPWIAVNGEASIALVCRRLRYLHNVEGVKIPHVIEAYMNRLDPPNCRCGRPGTRIIGRETFCSKCGPTSQARCNQRWWINKIEEREEEFEGIRAQSDEAVLRQRRLRHIAKFGKGRPR